jgi:hypothetical protein
VDPLWVPINDPVKEPVLICDELLTTPAGNVAVALNAYDAVVAKELDTVLVAQLLVPNSELVIPPLVTLILPDNILREPVFVIDPLEMILVI